MRVRKILAVAVAAAALGAAPRAGESATSPAVPTSRRAPTVRDDVRFVENAGQMREDVAFATFGNGPRAWLTRDGFSCGGVSIAFDGARGAAPRGAAQTPALFHWFVGKDGAEHPKHARSFASVVCDDAWPGVDLVFDARPHGIEYSLVVAAGADVSAARFVVRGASRVETTPDGGLVAGAVRQTRPAAWQDDADGVRTPVAVAFDVDGPAYRFRLGAHDASRPVVIDPTVQTDDLPIGLSGSETLNAVAMDADGNVFAVARAATAGLVPTGRPTYDATLSGGYDAFVGKYDSGGALLWASFLGSSSDQDFPFAVAVDSSRRPVVTGWTGGSDFPTTAGFTTGQTTGVFVARFAADGSALVHSNLFGGGYQGWPTPVAVGPDGAAYVASVGPDQFPSATKVIGARGAQSDAWIAKISATGHLDYLTETWADATSWFRRWTSGIAVDATGAAYVSGGTEGPGGLPPADVTTPYGGATHDAYAMKLDPGGTRLLYAVFIGGSGDDDGGAVAVDAAGAAYVVGVTNSSVATFPRVPIDDGQGGVVDPYGVFVVKLSPSGANRDFALALRYQGGVGGDPYIAASTGAAFDEKGRLWANYGDWTARITADGQTADVYAGVGIGTPAIRSSKEVWFHDDQKLVRTIDLTQSVAVPGAVAARATSARTVRVTWTSSAAGATGFVVERAPATGAFAAVGSPAASDRSFDDSGLSPDTSYRYRVRAVAGTDRSPPSQTVAVRTNGSFGLRVTTAKIVDSTKSLKDSLRLAATTSFETPTAFDPADDAFHLAIGEGAGAFVLDVAAGDPGWKGKAPKWRWKSSAGGTRSVVLALDLKRGRTTLSVTKTNFTGLPTDPAEVEIRAGDEADTDGPVWKRSGDVMKTP